MKNAFLRRLPLILLLVLGTTAVTSARSGFGHRNGPNTPPRHDIKAYIEANVLPVLRQQRQKLEPQLAPADQAKIIAFRAQVEALKTQRQALRQSLRPAAAAPGARPTLTDAQRQQAQALRLQGQQIMLSVAQLALKYDANIQKLAAEIQPQKAQWATDLKAIVAKDTTPEQQARLARWQGFAARRGGLGKLFKPAAFLLLDPNGPAENATPLGGTSLYPNPAAAATQLQYDVKKAGNVSVELLDGTGTKLRTLIPETQQEKGTYTQSLDLSDLPKGTYFYKITTKSGSETKRFVKE
ncbi:T9SS type A sorting domain-containing protein [Hymenobacter sp. UV11]|uniref:T9SS type A sorting domain-containing protein n=1 Tax=Hymenobacter sp. UV11 TaxID=1849735 RepID=UPI00105DE24C|nr:T9SS type A sorting domain-containing protein [Hymenobacter sp. UV11]TDN38195.1 hypothetical protein A8B98_24600 [Hymenobacter sp. UV11]TFZ67632.1 T9SS type A sorting domain-containing protein [Hymenobacter sp. UV11]